MGGAAGGACRDPVAAQRDRFLVLYDADEALAPRVATVLVQRGVENVLVLSGGLRVLLERFPAGLVVGDVPAALRPAAPARGRAPPAAPPTAAVLTRAALAAAVAAAEGGGGGPAGTARWGGPPSRRTAAPGDNTCAGAAGGGGRGWFIWHSRVGQRWRRAAWRQCAPAHGWARAAALAAAAVP